MVKDEVINRNKERKEEEKEWEEVKKERRDKEREKRRKWLYRRVGVKDTVFSIDG